MLTHNLMSIQVGKQVIVQEKQVRLSHQILSKFIVLLAFNVSALGQVSIYDNVKENYLTGDPYSISHITKQDLINEGIEGDKLYWALNLVARTNRKLTNYTRAFEIIQSIPLDSINYKPLYYDYHMLKALLYSDTNNYIKADSLYEFWIKIIPEKYNLLLAINYNDYGNVRLYFGDTEKALEYYQKSNYYNQFTTDDRKKARQTLYYCNLANLYLLLNKVKKSSYWFEKIDTLSIVKEEMILSYNKTKGKIELADERYEEAYASFIKVRDLASLYGFNDYRDDAVQLFIHTRTLQRSHFISEIIRNFFIVAGFICYTAFLIHRARGKNKMLTELISEANLAIFHDIS